MNNYFDRVVVISLKRRKDRLDKFFADMKFEWCFAPIEVFPAVDGKLIPQSNGWKGGQGAWGCTLSWRSIMEQAMTDKLNRILVFEDDAMFVADFPSKAKKFIEEVDKVDKNWECLMFGGQCMSPEQRINDYVAKCPSAGRTHAIGWNVKSRFFQDWYKELLSWNTHCDHKLSNMMSKYKSYKPYPLFIVGQNDTHSDITCRKENKRLWSKLPDNEEMILLQSPRSVKEALTSYLHFGYSIDVDGMDRGIKEVFDSPGVVGKLKIWIDRWGSEAWVENKTLAIWHPKATIEILKQVHKNVKVIKADTIGEAVKQLELDTIEKSINEKPIVLLRAPMNIVIGLREMGWHGGYWVDSITKIDNGLRRLMLGDDKVSELRDWIRIVGEEVKSKGWLALYHPDINLELLQKATDRKIIEVTGNTIRECLDCLEKSQ